MKSSLTTIIKNEFLEGALTTFGSVLRMGSEYIQSRSQLFIDGEAVYDQRYSLAEMERISVLHKNAV